MIISAFCGYPFVTPALVDYRAGVTKGYPQKAEIIIREALQKAGVK